MQHGLIKVYLAESNILGVTWKADINNTNHSMSSISLVEKSKRIVKDLFNVRKLYTKILSENDFMGIADALLTLIREQIVDWIGYTVFDQEKSRVLQEWRYEIREDRDSIFQWPSNIHLLNEVPFDKLNNLPPKTIFICHVRWSPSFLALSPEEQQHVLDETPWLLPGKNKQLTANAYPDTIRWHRPEWKETGERVSEEKLAQTASVRFTLDDIEWEPIATFPGKCLKGQSYELRLRLHLKILTNEHLINAEVIRLLAVITSEAFDISESYYQPIEIPFGREPKEISFMLTPKSDAAFGEKEILIDFFSATRRAGNMVLKAAISNPKYEIQPDVIGPSLSYREITISPSSGLRPRIVLMAYPKGEFTQYNIIDDLYGIFPLDAGCSKKVTLESAKEFINLFSSKAERFTSKEYTDENYPSIRTQFQALGFELYSRLPEELRNHFSNLNEGSFILIHSGSELQWVPWEIVFDGSRFWGEKFIISRLTKYKKSDREAIGGATFLSKVVHFLSTKISNSDELVKKAEETFLAAGLTSSFVVLDKDASTEIFQNRLSEFKPSLVHFTCHGGSENEEPTLFLGSKDHEILPLSVTSLLNLDFTTLVYANACASAQISTFWGEFISFGSAFLERGSKAFIGTLGIVPVVYAIEFAQTFYKLLFIEKRSIGEALWETKQQFKEKNNPFWLFYCLYGDASINFEKQLPVVVPAQASPV